MDSTKHRRGRAAVGLLLLTCLPLAAAIADNSGRHPYYLHALSDLRDARATIEQRRGGDPAVKDEEQKALDQIVDAIQDIKKASIDDGKNLDDHPPVDAAADESGALHKAEDILRRVRSDVGKEEDDDATRGLQRKILRHVDMALDSIKVAVNDVEQRH